MPFTLPNRPPKTDADPADPTCGHCGYCVRGIPQLTCPECGSDLREVGIIPANQRRFSSTTVKLTLWAFVAPPIAALLSCLLFVTVLPFGQTCKFAREIDFRAPYFNMVIWIAGAQHPWQPRIMGQPPISPETLNIWDSQSHNLDVQPRTGQFRYFKNSNGYQSVQGTNFSGKDLANCFAPLSANLDPHVQDLFNALHSIIVQTSRNIDTNKPVPLLDRAGNPIGVAHPVNSWVVYDEPNPILIAVLALFWLIIWIYGYRRILR